MLRVLYLIYFFIIALPIFIVVTIVCALTTIIGCSLGAKRIFSFWPGKLWARITLFLFLCPVKVEGRSNLNRNDLPAIIMPNHQSALDIFVMYGYLGVPFRFVLKESLRKMPIVGWACQACGFIFVDETKPSSIKNTLRDGKKALTEGTSIVLYPEGHRTRNGKIGTFKRGGFVIAYQLGVPLIPIAINNAYDALPYGSYIPKPRTLTMAILPSYTLPKSSNKAEAISVGMEHMYNTIAKKL